MITDTLKIVLLLISITLTIIIIIHYIYNNTPKISHNDNKKVIRKIRCPPPFHNNKVHKIEEVNKDVLIYNDNDYIKNTGFKNELIYNRRSLQEPDRHSKLNSQYDTLGVAPLINNGECIDKNICYDFKHKEYKTDLPIANINVNYLLNKNNSVKLSEQMNK